MKIFIKNLPLFAIFGLMISSYGFAGGTSKVKVNFPDDSFNLHTQQLVCYQYGYDNDLNRVCTNQGWKNIEDVTKKCVDGWDINPSKDNWRFIVSHNGTDIAASKIHAKKFQGFAGWNWTFKKDENFIREGLDTDFKKVLLQEINTLGNVTYDKRKGNTKNYIDVNSWINS